MITGLTRSIPVCSHHHCAAYCRSFVRFQYTSRATLRRLNGPTCTGLRPAVVLETKSKGLFSCQAPARLANVTASSKDCDAIIVEGYADKVAVQRAVPCAVFVLGSSTWVEGKNAAAVLSKLKKGLATFQKTYVLTDPDFAGRKGRNILEATFPGQLWHAFIPAASATSSQKTRWHEAGNIGVEHSSPETIRDALANSRLASLGRTHFTREKLVELGLTASFDDPLASKMRERRDVVCNSLGIGSCDGKQLLRQLNVFNFTDEDLHKALQQLG